MSDVPRPALSLLLLCLFGLLPESVANAGIDDPHMDPGLLPTGCRACHRGHGESGSPMLPAPQKELCLSCHDSPAAASRLVGQGALTPEAQPRSLASALQQPFTHPLDDAAFSRREPDVVTCTSCHSPHRGSKQGAAGITFAGTRKLSTRDPSRFEYELCQDCHGGQGVTTQSLQDLSRLTNPNSRSSHPIEAPSLERSPSLQGELAGKELNCTDCHGNSDRLGAAGPHGSATRYILRRAYTTTDGEQESEKAYALCYACHDRDAVLDGPVFPLHRLHVVEVRSSCATCHSAHGSAQNRALIRFGEETYLAGVGPSGAAGRLGFESEAPGSGSCFLTCHGVDHAPLGYGAPGLEALEAVLDGAPPGAHLRPGMRARPPREPRAEDLKRPPG